MKSRKCLLKKIQRLSSREEELKNKEKTKIVTELRQEYPLEVLLLISKLSRSTYYYHLKNLEKADKYATIKEEINEIFHENKGRYGYRRITIALRKRGHLINHKTVQKLMKQLGLICLVRIKKYRSYRGKVGKIAPNLLERDFKATKANQKWVTDVTEFSLFGQKVYLSPILDLYNGEIVSFSITDRPTYKQIQIMLDKAFEKHIHLENLLFHSDQGWQYQMKSYQNQLKEKGIIQSMSRKGNCLDNSVMENFFGLLKSELLYLQEFTSIDHFKRELEDYIHWYNTKRIKSKLKGLSPIEYRIQSLEAA
ncbi:IS3 family transposase [Tepidibacter sp. Z1-5]|uniref:IS3 family transposase n=1 Tax=Tepidibacter sp. Z1-5 TaxID=3134138 RepID=UPI0030C24AF9